MQPPVAHAVAQLVLELGAQRAPGAGPDVEQEVEPGRVVRSGAQGVVLSMRPIEP
jgi:hypothetical protein